MQRLASRAPIIPTKQSAAIRSPRRRKIPVISIFRSCVRIRRRADSDRLPNDRCNCRLPPTGNSFTAIRLMLIRYPRLAVTVEPGPPRSGVSRAPTCDGMRPAAYATEFIADRHQALEVSGLQRPSPITVPPKRLTRYRHRTRSWIERHSIGHQTDTMILFRYSNARVQPSASPVKSLAPFPNPVGS